MPSPSMTMSLPLWLGGAALADAIKYIPESYSHSSDVNGGYKSCQFAITCSALEAEDWYTSLGNHIEVSGDGLDKVWEGFVNSVDINIGPTTITRGPLMDVVNRLTVSYSEVSRGYNLGGVNTTLGGEQLYTTPYNDTDSQDIWGIQEMILSAGSINPGEIAYLPQAYTDDNKHPPVSQNVSMGAGGGGEAVVTVSCLGYVAFLDKFIYSEESAGSVTIDLDQKIKNILADDPNGIFSTDYSKIDSNTTAVSRYESDYKLAKGAITELVPLGDSSFNRYIWGVYNDRVVEYHVIPTDIRYIYSILDGKSRIVEVGGGEVNPWEVMPGEFIQIINLLPGITTDSSDKKKDPRIMFIESVEYSAPFGIQISGGKFDTISQRINRLGLGNF